MVKIKKEDSNTEDIHRENMFRWYLNQKKKRGKCSNCPENDPVCIDFHHVDPIKKVGTILDMIKKGSSLRACQLELEKMIPLCSNCHRKLEYKKKKLNGFVIE